MWSKKIIKKYVNENIKIFGEKYQSKQEVIRNWALRPGPITNHQNLGQINSQPVVQTLSTIICYNLWFSQIHMDK